MNSLCPIRESFREIDQQIDDSYNKITDILTRMRDIVQRMLDKEHRKIVVSKSSIDASKSSTTIEAKMIVPCQMYVSEIQQPIEVLMPSSALNEKLIVLPESIEVNLMLKVTGPPVTMKGNQMSLKTPPCSTMLLTDTPSIMEQFVMKNFIVEGTIQRQQGHEIIIHCFVTLLPIGKINQWLEQSEISNVWDTTTYDPGGSLIHSNYNLEDKVVVDEWSNDTCINKLLLLLLLFYYYYYNLIIYVFYL
ncbi:hypothetical protein QL285_074154 [Trifolium repens]|nr:hypothetical protein QL285_074154 [Trifolium repens]